MIDIYFSNASAIHSAEIYLHLLPFDAIEKFRRYRNKQDAILFLVGRLLLLHGLANLNREYLQLSQIMYTEAGKPFFMDSSIQFSISHSGDWTFCVIANCCAVGLDIEKKHDINFSDFHRIFSAKERDMLANTSRKKDLFYSLWSRKEAIVKADGCGISAELNKIEVVENPIIFNAKKWYWHEYDILTDYSVSLVCDQMIVSKPVPRQCFF